MTAMKNILIFSAIIIPAIFIPAHSEQALWNSEVFPNDRQWLLSWKRGVSKDLVQAAEPKKYKLCETPECKKVGEEFSSSMNKSVDPCENFYEFACGKWTPEDTIPGYLAQWSRFMIFQVTVQQRIKAALEIEPEPSDILPVRQAKKWYRSCMDSETLDRRGIRPIETILMQTGGWPIAMDEEEWDAEDNTWQKVEKAYARLTGSYVLYTVGGSPRSEYSDSEYGTVDLSSGAIPLAEQLPLKYRNYSGNDYETYVRLVEGAAELFVRHNRANVSKDKIRKDAKKIVEFEKELYTLSDKGRGFESMTFDEFIEWYEANVTAVSSEPAAAKINWKSVIQDAFNMVNVKIHPSAEVDIMNVDYILGIGELLRKTPARTIVNYIHWKFVANMMPYTTDLVRNELFEFAREEFGLKERPPRWKECVNDMKMTHAAAYAFVNKFFATSTETSVLEMVKNIQRELEKKIDNSNWMDEESKILSKEKLNNMKIFIGFPDWYKNRTALINFYKGVSIGSEYFDNSLNYIRYMNKQDLKSYTLTRRRSDEDWAIDPITVNALYNPFDNTVNVPAVDFQSPLFTKGLPDNVNYGIAGLIVGHEMSHGFDDIGITMSGNDGNHTELSEQFLKAYYQRAECFLDQFEDYYGETKAPPATGEQTTVDWMESLWMAKMRSKGALTRGENIADTTGLQAVFEAYRKLDKPEGHARIPGLEEFTDDQLFFLSFAAMWCEVETPKFAKKRAESMDPHSPSRYRVIGAVSNTKNFAKAFNCPKGSPMNPDYKCDIWDKPGAVPKADSNCKKTNSHRWGGQWEH